MNSFFSSKVRYCRYYWGCKEIDHLHKKCLSLVDTNKTWSFENLLEKGKSVPIHIRKLQILATEIFKVNRDLAPTIFTEFFKRRNVQYNLRHASQFSVLDTDTCNRTGSLSFLGPKMLGSCTRRTQKGLKHERL